MPQEQSEALGDVITDVVVVGSGPGGLGAVAAAAASGADVVAIEVLPNIGGNAVWSTGYLIFVGSAAQDALGIEDSEELFIEDCRRLVDATKKEFGVVWDENLTRLFARESAETYRILTDRGVRFSRLIPRPDLHSVERIHATEDTWAYQRVFQPDFDRPNVTAMLETRVERLLKKDARVTGVIARRADGQATTVHARHGVVLAAGGYQANPALRGRYQPEFIADSPYLGVDTARGDGQLLGQSVGGDLINMAFVEPLIMVSSSLTEDAIAVNNHGKRFHDEAGTYAHRVERLLAQPDRRAHYVFDDVVASEKAKVISQMPQPPVTRDNMKELAEAIGVSASELKATIEEWNCFLSTDADKDPKFDRVVMPPGRRPIATPPFTAVPMVVGSNFTGGGFRVTQEMQVIDLFGSPIPGLYAAGDCVGGLSPVADLGGMHISGGFTLGRVAGNAVARGSENNALHSSVFGVSSRSQVDFKLALFDVQGTPD
jgi:succinate dehydrogenase/fumarate reductase flavoprotein subunit